MRTVTIISNYNESELILETINDIRSNASIETDILVIDNSSNTITQSLLKNSGVDYIIHPVNTGGSAGVIKTAFAYAQYHGYDVYCHMDGDNQHTASELDKIMEPIINDKADFVFGSRFIKKEGFQSYALRRMGISLFSKILTILTKSKLTDVTSGFRAYNRKAIEYFALEFKHEIEACVQMPLVAFHAGLSITEVPVVMRPRTAGKSEINIINAIKFPVYGTISLIGTLMQRH